MSNEQQLNHIGIINAGAWGTAVAKVLAEKGHQVTIWEPMESVVKEINTERKNSRFLLGVTLPDTITATTDLNEAAGNKDYLILATPSLYIVDIAKKLITIPEIMEGKTVIGVLTKGFIDIGFGPTLITKALEDYLPGFYKGSLVYLSGPSHAEEVARGKLTGLISASANGRNAIRFRQLFASTNLMLFSSLDTTGVQTCAAVKNVIAIAFGMLDALKELSDLFGDNTESLLLAAGLNEIQIIGQALGATHPETFTSIAGVGDLDVTCRSRYGRNRRFGSEIIKAGITRQFSDLEDLIRNIHKIGYLPEGAVASKYVHAIVEDKKLKLPICDMVYRILNREHEPLEALTTLMRGLTGPSFALPSEGNE
ncbi:NAD(P)H-dependent glycerol-3-phosphate dehydrogenase [Sediminispirochaeta smaragdinae]|jgi:glycerol-3-phosphate dehydrogenase (NAD(P)+)|uniref:Glycerol-3-phosphate dehydrogenase [NAD(P)+] n=1 Tax=Sediminispirochaeta smaragdinae (strain DSM 11293 / JCM 15392 / SEBR 4228) TaxID=573413 RepID=E1RCC7_SEDSS|nr:NAD(P)H-dependent glycerol-3-phosphate dehydrogenase [Sediminispirochaeta smaragdinae]ADK80007.1 NAD-dependent glycerol-3-phosphate dehydrogenase domain protein [Sediminispirochaeta smaragdinae DSM 11293]